jgi:non-canonical purine NTP pyrophosphatase (RdgB/HAM1 family)
MASGNAGKIREIERLLDGLGVEVVAQTKLGVTDADETGTTFAENSLIKAQHAAQATGLPAIADDSGLSVDALDGAPGVYSARYAGGVRRASGAAQSFTSGRAMVVLVTTRCSLCRTATAARPNLRPSKRTHAATAARP